MFGQINSNQYFEMSKKLTTDKDFDKALSSIDNALKIDSLNRTYLLQKVKVLYYKSDCESGLIILNKLLTKEKKPDDETISYFCDLADCLNESAEASEILTDYVEKKKFKSNEIIVKLAQRLYLEKNYEKSIYYYTKYLKLNSKDIDAIIDLARITYSYKGSEEGIKIIKSALNNNENNIDLSTCLSNFYFIGKDYQKAIEIENQIIKLNYNVTHIATRAMLYEKIEKLDKAYEDNKTVISLLKCNSEYYYTKVLQYEFDNKLFKDVVKHSLELIECNKSYEASIIDGFYTSLFFCGDFEKGKIYLEKKLAIAPDTFNPYYLKLLILFKDRQYDDILKYMDLASKTKDIDSTNLNNINLLKFGYYLVKEDYEGFINYWKSGEVKSLDNNLNFTFVEGTMSDKTKVETNFNKETGVINTTLIIPTKVFRLLMDKYNFKMEINTKK
jgi:tetratricopeptide (TPR) repeat protein